MNEPSLEAKQAAERTGAGVGEERRAILIQQAIDTATAKLLDKIKEHEPCSLDASDGIDRLVDSLGSANEETAKLREELDYNVAVTAKLADDLEEQNQITDACWEAKNDFATILNDVHKTLELLRYEKGAGAPLAQISHAELERLLELTGGQLAHQQPSAKKWDSQASNSPYFPGQPVDKWEGGRPVYFRSQQPSANELARLAYAIDEIVTWVTKDIRDTFHAEYDGSCLRKTIGDVMDGFLYGRSRSLTSGQPSATTPEPPEPLPEDAEAWKKRTDAFPIPDPTTPDVEKIAQDWASYDQFWSTQAVVEANLLKFAEKVRAPLVELLADVRPTIMNAAHDPVASPWQKDIREKFLQRVDAALTGTEEAGMTQQYKDEGFKHEAGGPE